MKDVIEIWKDQSRSFQAVSKKSRLRQLIEICYFKVKGFSPKSYYTIPLYSEYKKRQLISEKEYNKMEKDLNKRQIGVFAFDKWVQSCFWKANGLPHARTLGFFKKEIGHFNGETFKATEDNLHNLFKKAVFPLVIKPIDGSNGIGFEILSRYNDKNKIIETLASGSIPLEKLQDVLFFDNNINGYVIQERIEQHPELERVFPKAANSLRVVTHMDSEGNFTVDSAMMKFGAGDSITDNNNEGRVFAFMDLSTGQLGNAYTGSYSHTPVRCHPDSKKEISGFIVPFWKESLALAIKAHSTLPFPRHLGWDIGICLDGPLIIEPNSFLAIPVYQKDGQDLARLSALGKVYQQQYRSQ